MHRYVLLLPTVYNDGRKVPHEVIDLLFAELIELLGKYTLLGPAKGVYRMQDGRLQEDELLVVWLAVEPHQTDSLRRIAGRFAAVLGQETLYLERVEGTVELVPAGYSSPPKEGAT